MFTLPFEVLHVIVCFAPLFSKRVWEHAKVLLIGAILALGGCPRIKTSGSFWHGLSVRCSDSRHLCPHLGSSKGSFSSARPPATGPFKPTGCSPYSMRPRSGHSPNAKS